MGIYILQIWNRQRVARIPQDGQVVDIDYMSNRRDFTVSTNFTGLDTFVTDTIHASHRRLILIIDPAIASSGQDYAPLQDVSVIQITILLTNTGSPIRRVCNGRSNANNTN
jgi:alpha-glucosidase (family GH31 glycosyl hydrolase)